MTTANLFLELGTEELPAGAAPVAAEALLTKLVELLDAAGIAHGEATWLGTPRRMLAHVAAVALAQPDREVVATGPAWKVAKTDDGQWSKAAEAFAKSQGVALDALESVDTAKGAYIAARKQVIGRPTADLVTEALPGIFRGLPIPKRMRWATEKEAFLRPVHWLVALLGDAVLPVAFAGVQSGQTSMGHRFLANRPVQASSDLAHYQQCLMDAFVLVDPAQRRKVIERGLGQLAAEAGGVWRRDDVTLETVVWLTEWPAPLLGNFDPAFLAIPPEVIFTTLRENQKLFLLEKPDGSLLPNFLGVANTLQESSRQTIADGNRRVVSARLSDAKFFYQEDVKQTLLSRTAELRKQIYLQGLGSIDDKIDRLSELGVSLVSQLVDANRSVADRSDLQYNVSIAARLCKCDLATRMVFEFPELQGVIGGYYARHEGVPSERATAISEHYRPRSSGDSLPSTMAGKILSLADKADTIAGCFALGLVPSGTQDPYALRRQAIGILRILATEPIVRLTTLVDLAITQLPIELRERLGAQGREQVLTFFRTRLLQNANVVVLPERPMTEREEAQQIFPTSLVDAVLAANYDDIWTIGPRLRALGHIRAHTHGQWDDLAAAMKRVCNLVKKSGAEVPRGVIVDVSLMTTDAERTLFLSTEVLRSKVECRIADGEWLEALKLLSTIKPEVDAFFDGVMVLVDDVAVRRNRLALLQQTAGLFAPIADFARIAA